MRLFPLLLLLLSSCFLLPLYQRSTFSYAGADGQTAQVPLLLPRGFRPVQGTDSAGRPIMYYRYAGGAEIYIARGAAEGLPYFDTTYHISQPHLQGGRFFKGQEADREFWREVRTSGFRIGYRNVPRNREPEFDSALNYIRIASSF